MLDAALKCFDLMAGVALVPEPVEILGRDPELDDKIAGEVLRLDFPTLLPPKAEEGGFIVAHDNSSIRAADEGPAVVSLIYIAKLLVHGLALLRNVPARLWSCLGVRCYQQKLFIRAF
jgi:hypothetical protein